MTLVTMLCLKAILFLVITASLTCGLNFDCNNITLVRREEWGSTAGVKQHNMPEKPGRIFVHHTNTEECKTTTDCIKLVRGEEKFHKELLGQGDIDVQFLIGGDGKVYEGRGWDATGPHTLGYPNDFGVAFIGTFNKNFASVKMMNAFRELIICGIQHGAIKKDHSIYGHRDARMWGQD
uniref:Peptidoglycan-recognition protein n=1 Tax=Strigamia maritima TaxID=126957 RepID=T1JP23_STRMM